ncbi:MAG: hypothetical protein EOM55_03125 [Clostridia bacterium]|nr:hypothetical protein [Clostridia bacterium]
MKKNLFDFASEKFDEKEEKICQEDLEKKIDENTKTNAKDLYKKYKNYSKDELVDEFLSSSKEKIKQGSLSKDKIRETLSSVAPYMNQNQKNFFENLLSKLDE